MCFNLYKWYQIALNITSEFAINVWELSNLVVKIDGNLVVKSKAPPLSGSLALRQLNPIHKKWP